LVFELTLNVLDQDQSSPSFVRRKAPRRAPCFLLKRKLKHGRTAATGKAIAPSWPRQNAQRTRVAAPNCVEITLPRPPIAAAKQPPSAMLKTCPEATCQSADAACTRQAAAATGHRPRAAQDPAPPGYRQRPARLGSRLHRPTLCGRDAQAEHGSGFSRQRDHWLISAL